MAFYKARSITWSLLGAAARSLHDQHGPAQARSVAGASGTAARGASSRAVRAGASSRRIASLLHRRLPLHRAGASNRQGQRRRPLRPPLPPTSPQGRKRAFLHKSPWRGARGFQGVGQKEVRNRDKVTSKVPKFSDPQGQKGK